MIDAAQWISARGPHLHFAEEQAALAACQQVRQLGGIVRVGNLRGVRDARRLFAEFARALELPDYFGHNWDALDECLRDRPGGKSGQPVVLVLHNALGSWREAAPLMARLVDCWLSAAIDSADAGRPLHLVFAW